MALYIFLHPTIPMEQRGNLYRKSQCSHATRESSHNPKRSGLCRPPPLTIYNKVRNQPLKVSPPSKKTYYAFENVKKHTFSNSQAKKIDTRKSEEREIKNTTYQFLRDINWSATWKYINLKAYNQKRERLKIELNIQLERLEKES